MRTRILIGPLMAALMLLTTSRAEEGGSGHYAPGSVASFIDAFPNKPGGFTAVNYFTYYDASASASRPLLFGAFLTGGIDATVYADTISLWYQAPWDVLSGGLAVGVAVPWVWMEVSGSAQRIGINGRPGQVIQRDDSVNGLGDISFIPFMLGWTNLLKDLTIDERITVYAPTGSYDKNRLANPGLNYWTVEPGIMASWLSSTLGTEFSLYTGIDFNTRNDATDYTSGTAVHIDGTLAQHLPLGKGFIGVGANGFFYQQLTGDTGSGTLLGSFTGMTTGVGPVLSYILPMGKNNLFAEVKWLNEVDVEKRLKGNYVWFKLGIQF